MALPQGIQCAAVIGAGTMGRQIAAMIANADTHVLLLDIVPKGANDRDMLANDAIGKLKGGQVLWNERKAANIRPGNMEDDLDRLRQADWVIECVPEDAKVKRDAYQKIGAHTDPHTLVSSNTSTIPLRRLREGLEDGLQRRLCITHFFNPPGVMPLMELVADQDNDPQAVESFAGFADRKLGKNVVMAKDTPGFIANRIGLFWLLCAMEEAQKENLPVELADAVMNGAFGFPKTGVFGLADLIGLKLIPDIAGSMSALLPPDDAFCQLESGLAMVQARIDAGGEQPGFYQKNASHSTARKPDVAIGHWHEFLGRDAPESRFALRSLTRLLAYAAQVTPEIAESIADADAAMRDGYGWEQGPFEMIDRLGASWLIERLNRGGAHVPMLLKQAEAQGFYPLRTGMGKQYLGFSGRYHVQQPEKDKWTLALKTAGSMPVLDGETARLWDIGDGIACFGIATDMGVIGERELEALTQAIEKAEADFQGMVIGHDGRHFSAGLNLHIILDSAGKNDWSRIERLIRQGQETLLRVKTARVPIIPALTGYALGGGCELAMHCIAAQAHASTRIGLVEVDIGVIPAWGGTKEHLVRAVQAGNGDMEKIAEAGLTAFRQIARAQKSAHAQDAFAMGLLTDASRISANRGRLLPDAKTLCVEWAAHYQPRREAVIETPMTALHERFLLEIEEMCVAGPDLDMHRKKTLYILAGALSGFAAARSQEVADKEALRPGWRRLTERQLLDSTCEAFMELVEAKEALEKIGKAVGR